MHKPHVLPARASTLPADFSLSSDAFPLVPSLHRLGLQALSQTYSFPLSDSQKKLHKLPLILPETLTPWSGPLSSHHHSSLHHSYPPVHVDFPPYQSGPSPNSFSSISIPFLSAALPPSLASPPHPILQQGASTGSCILNEDSRDGRNECHHLNQRRTYKTRTMT